MATGLEISWTKPPPLSPAISTRLSKPAHARIENFCHSRGLEKATVLRELIARGWKEAFGTDIDTPA
jgi:hypothetical protein